MSVINIDFWSKKTVLVTGAAGFIGSHLCERLVNQGSRVRALIRYNSANSFGLIELMPAETREKMKIISGDITDEASLHKAIKDTDIVFHMAAIPSIPYSIINPRHVYRVNTFGTMNVLSLLLANNYNMSLRQRIFIFSLITPTLVILLGRKLKSYTYTEDAWNKYYPRLFLKHIITWNLIIYFLEKNI